MSEMLLNVSLVAILTALFKMLVPNTSFRKQISFLVSCFFLSAVFTAVSGGTDLSEVADSFTAQSEYVDFSRTYIDSVGEKAAEVMSDKIKELLAAENIYPEQVYIIVNISDDMSISIVKTELVFAEENGADAEYAAQLVRKSVGDDIEVAAVIGG